MNQYLEIIELRTTGQNREKVEKVLEELMDGLNLHAEEGQVQVYNSLAIASDFCIHLHIQSESANSTGSPLGLQIAATLEEYGLIYHNIWHEMSFQESDTNINA